MPIEALSPGNVAVVTGAASGIGLAAANRFAAAGLKVVLVDRPGPRLDEAAARVAEAGTGDAPSVQAEPADVSDRADLVRLERQVRERFGRIDVLMNNAGIQPGSDILGPEENWSAILATNLMGVIQGSQVFAPGMIAQGTPGLIVNTGSKQGITTPPGDPAYNVAKAGVKVFTEALQHDLRNRDGCRITAHLLIPGFVYTGITAKGRTEKPDAAWTPEQTVDFMMDALERGDFYILCPDNDVTRAIDERRMLWAMGDIVENRPPLSRWHPDYADRFKAFVDRQ
ncbi:SDR family NAD(P)-dependent oxidoreductase [Marinivivus vitaminiproducens]|uniref:SDR family NAD(P)-dependent oxidoreductase n=1 Tax=Marinivivus vitaminiproducens TaxID=3035935 RepID=UPI0027A72DAB|nr:SDR family NAD(P)-dependent oxidoreductase [Geminicoccaceae bacterium SCSIO 64248]